MTLAGGKLSASDANLVIDGSLNGRVAIDAAGQSPILVASSSSLTLRNMELRNGSGGACQLTVAVGGAICASNTAGTLLLDHSTIAGSSSKYGGAIWSFGDVTLQSSTISGNRARVRGGGIYARGNLSVAQSTFSGNRAGDEPALVSGPGAPQSYYEGEGGAIEAHGDVTITGSTFSGNIGRYGSAIRLDDTAHAVHLSDVTLGGNGTPNDTTISVANASNTGPFSFDRVIVSGSGTAIRATRELTITGSDNLVHGATMNVTFAAPPLLDDPRLGPLTDNGGGTWTMMLLPGSPAIDAGGMACSGTDQRGVTRPRGGSCDIGAVEAVQLRVDTEADGVGDDGACSLREAIANAGGGSGQRPDCATGTGFDQITFADDVHVVTLAAASGALQVAGTRTWIDGMHADGSITTVSGGGATMVFSNPAGTNTTIEHLDIVQGHATGGAWGGGINNNGNLALRDVTLADNHSDVHGGALATTAGALELDRVTVSGNSAAGRGGGLFLGWSQVMIGHSTLAGNSAGASGGGIDIEGSQANVLLDLVVLANGTGGDCHNNGGTLAVGFSLVQDAASAAACGIPLEGGTNVGGDPLLHPLQDAGGGVWVHVPGTGSPAIDAAGTHCDGADQRGVARPQGASCDIGAVEARRYALGVGVTGSGSVSSSPAGIGSCASGSGACSADFVEGENVLLTATPAANWHVDAWGGACSGTGASATVAMVEDRDCTATFVLDTHAVGGSIANLSGSGLVLHIDHPGGGADLAVPNGNASFAFPALPYGTAYTISAAAQPTHLSQTCSVENGSGTIGGADVTDVAVACTTNLFNVAGTVSGVVGTGLVLRINGIDLPFDQRGGFSLPFPDGSDYTVAVLAQPSGPAQTCEVANGSGTLDGADAANVDVTCTTDVDDTIFRAGFEPWRGPPVDAARRSTRGA